MGRECIYSDSLLRNGRLGITGLMKVSCLPSATSVAGLPVLMSHHQDSNAALEISIYDRVRKNFQWECSSPFRRWRSEIGIFNQEFDDTFKFFEKMFSNHKASLFLVKIQGAGNIMLRFRVERIIHRVSLARSRAMASCPEIAEIEPDSSSASLRSASRSQASSTSGSESRLAISRSSRCDRSTGGNRRTSASRTSRFVLTLTSNVVDAEGLQFTTASGAHSGANASGDKRCAAYTKGWRSSRFCQSTTQVSQSCPPAILATV